jgi:hypothetical protein
MPDDDDPMGYEDMAEPQPASPPEVSDPTLPSLADAVAGAAADPDEALGLCDDLRNAENLSDDQFDELLALVEARTDWELPRMSY